MLVTSIFSLSQNIFKKKKKVCGKVLKDRCGILNLFLTKILTFRQMEVNRKKDAELAKLRKDIELLTIQFEGQEASMRKKNQEALNDLNDQVDYLSKTKHR